MLLLVCGQVKSIGEEIGVSFLGLGFNPKWAVENIPIMPKGEGPHHLAALLGFFLPGRWQRSP